VTVIKYLIEKKQHDGGNRQACKNSHAEGTAIGLD
jgi:hypothetical protein